MPATDKQIIARIERNRADMNSYQKMRDEYPEEFSPQGLIDLDETIQLFATWILEDEELLLERGVAHV